MEIFKQYFKPHLRVTTLATRAILALMSSHRLFIALRPPKAIRAFLLEKMLGVAAARWQNDDQLHITLRFIGAVDRHQGEDIAAALGHLYAPAPLLHINGVGHFEKSGYANALWAGVSPAAPLEALHQKINQMLLRVGIAPETRAYLPHITLARLGRSAGPLDGYLAANAALSSPTFTCDHAILYESEMGRGGSVYLPIARFPLAPSTNSPIPPPP